MSVLVDLFIVGTPVPQGSKRIGRHGRHPVILDANDQKLRPWRDSIQAQLWDRTSIAGPSSDAVKVEATFHLPCPKSLPKRSTPAHTKKPDIDKLIRALLDACTGIVFVDDSQVVALVIRKQYARNEHHQHTQTGVHLRVELLTEQAALAV